MKLLLGTWYIVPIIAALTVGIGLTRIYFKARKQGQLKSQLKRVH